MNYIKTNTKWARQRGTTLIELSIVIAVLLLLAGVLFIGVQAWQNAANNAACIVNQSSIQKAMRGYANFNGMNVGDPIAATALTTAPAGGAAMFNVMPTCPIGAGANPYTLSATIPLQGVEYALCATPNSGNNGAPHIPAPATITNW